MVFCFYIKFLDFYHNFAFWVSFVFSMTNMTHIRNECNGFVMILVCWCYILGTLCSGQRTCFTKSSRWILPCVVKPHNAHQHYVFHNTWTTTNLPEVSCKVYRLICSDNLSIDIHSMVSELAFVRSWEIMTWKS